MSNVGNSFDAVLLARTAVKGAAGATPVVRALLLERLAWAQAKAGAEYGTWRTLDAVDDAYKQRGEDEPEWVYWLNRNEIDVMAGRCLIELGRAREAEPLLSAAITNYPAEHAREIALFSPGSRNPMLVSAIWTRLTMSSAARRYGSPIHSPRAEERVTTVERLLA
jgi:hypothetical protein